MEGATGGGERCVCSVGARGVEGSGGSGATVRRRCGAVRCDDDEIKDSELCVCSVGARGVEGSGEGCVSASGSLAQLARADSP